MQIHLFIHVTHICRVPRFRGCVRSHALYPTIILSVNGSEIFILVTCA